MKSLVIIFGFLALSVQGSVLRTENYKEYFPWHAILHMFYNNAAPSKLCGGALISKEIVLTAASCIDKADRILLRFGTQYEWLGGVQFKGMLWKIHEQYNAETLENNIALVRILFISADNVKPIALPNAEEVLGGDEQLITSGFGVHTSVRQPYNVVDVNSLSLNECGDENKVCCTTNVENSLCKHDAGSPLVKLTSNGPVLVGITSDLSGLECVTDQPVHFIRTNSYLTWINETINNMYHY